MTIGQSGKASRALAWREDIAGVGGIVAADPIGIMSSGMDGTVSGHADFAELMLNSGYRFHD
ncbi:hypothetical protein [Mycobacterium sp. 852013-50091_SCH5140682]|uniref:hypothetical protein n=1 Tax=Mycobacterium sp. 852013-50091_SCH5140682 TaxID=1834109 RepID=UPI0012EA29C7|nr:hypothetical protein [Mycobacterium sp. 852013-50091_SCH5140682]